MTYRFPTYDDVVRLRAARDRKAANARLTALLCAGYRMNAAVAQIGTESVTLGIHAAELAMERS